MGGRTVRGKRILGDHKTWRGLLFGIIAAIVIVLLQTFLYQTGGVFEKLSLINYSEVSVVALGFLLGFGALFGDAVKSFFKRQLAIASGNSWVPFDQLDFILGALLLSSLIVWPGWDVAGLLLVVTPLLHVLMNWLAFKIDLKEVPW